jgi:class 3 adenylate cyclase/tetratricopeptide (TPR) repeat protein
VICRNCGRVNPDEARFCNACASPLETEARGLVEERKVVTVVFVDLVGFTARAERLDPEDVRGVLAPYHARLRSELERYGGTVEKFIGDAVMAVFGAPVAHEDDAERAVRAALAIRDWVAEQPDMQVRIAVHTGEAVVSLDARPVEGEALVAGDVVNTAARVQAAAPVNGVLVGEVTYRATRDAISYRGAEPVQAKGKSEPIPVWAAVEPVARLGVDVTTRPTTALVGRDRELALLRSLLQRVREERSAQLVTLVGVPGIGKSRLVAELAATVEGDEELVTWRQGRCLPYGESVTYWALGEIIKAEAGILETDAPAAAETKLTDAVIRLVSDPSEQRWMVAELRALVGLAAGAQQRSTAESATAAWRRFLEAVAERRPAVFVLEDLHWADEGLLDFVDDLVDWLRTVPVLIVATARPELLERRQSWGGGKANASSISLQPLTEEEIVRLIAGLLEQPLQLADDQRTLLDRAGGNPLFAEQYARMLGERGTTAALPESVQALIASRLDALPKAEKGLLQEAAVHGKVFWVGGVASAGGIPAAEVDRHLRALERKDFVRRERASTVAGDTKYSFQHVLLRDVAYGQIPRRERAQKHRRAGDWLEGLGRPDDHAELLAHHYQQALELARAAGVEDDPGLVQQARAALRAAGERAATLSAFVTAAGFFADALALASAEDSDRPQLLLERARSLVVLGEAPLDLATEALEAFRAAGDDEGQADAATTLARLAWRAGNRAETDRYMSMALEAVHDRPASRARANALASQCGFLMLAGRFEESIAVGAEALMLAEELELDDQRARVHILVGCSRCCLGDSEGFTEIESGIAIADAAGAVTQVSLGYANLSSELVFFARLDEARTALQRAVDTAERHGLAISRRSQRNEAAGWAFADGRWGEALEIADELLGADGSPAYGDPIMLALRAWILMARGDAVRAENDSARAVALAEASDAQAQSAAFCLRAHVALASGKRGECDELASRLLDIGTVVVPALCSLFPMLTDVAWLFRDLGREPELREVILDATPIPGAWVKASKAICDGDLRRAAEIVDGVGHPAAAAYAHLRAATALAESGDVARAEAERALAEPFYSAAGAAFLLEDSAGFGFAPRERQG